MKYQPVGSSPQVWLARLTAEQGNPSSSASARTKHALDVWKEAQSNSRLSPGENSQENLQSLKDLWLWGVPNRGAISEHSDTRVIFDVSYILSCFSFETTTKFDLMSLLGHTSSIANAP